jgi:hypothetical protein
MPTITKNDPPTDNEVQFFLRDTRFNLPLGFLEFFRSANGADLKSDEKYVLLWPLTDMVQLNKDYLVDEYAPDFFIFGSDGGDTAYAIERKTGDIYEMPFIGMSREEAVFKGKSFVEFIESI